jgi:class 3 adenylate cyclase
VQEKESKIMNKNWRTNLGGAVSVTGTTLIGVGVLGNLSPGSHSGVLWYIALAGFILSAIGKGLTAVFAADATTVANVAAAVDTINQQGANPMAAPAVSQPTEPKI